MLLSIAAENWRSHKDTRLEFDKGTNLLVGIMGSGKSSILDAISFALFGTFPALERRKLSLFDVVRLNEQVARVSLEFLWDGKRCRVERRIERKKGTAMTDAEAYLDGRIVEKGTSAVNKYIEQLLHVDYDLFTRAIYSEQNNIDYFLMLDPRRRKQEMDSLLGLDRFEEARANCTSLVNRIRNSRKELEARFSKEKLADSRKQLEELRNRLEAIRGEATELALAAESAKAKAEAAEQGFSELRKKKESHEKTTKEILILETRIAVLKKETDGKSASETELKELAERANGMEREKGLLDTSMKELERKLSSLNVSIGSLDARMKLAQKNKDEMERLATRLNGLLKGKTREGLVSEQEGLQSIIQAMESEARFLRSKSAEVEDSLGKLRPGISECPVCGNGLGDDTVAGLITRKKQELNGLKEQAESKAKNALELKRKLAAMQEDIRNVELAHSRLELVGRDADVAPLLAQMNERNEELAAFRKESEGLNIQREKLADGAKELRSLHKEKELLLGKIMLLTEAEAGLAKAMETLAALGYDEDGYERVRSGLESARIELERMAAKRMQAESELKSCDGMKGLLERELGRMQEMEAEISSSMKLEEELSIYKNALVQTQASMRNELIASINEAMNEIWGIFYPYRDYRMLRLSANEKDYQFEVHDTGWKPLESVASGGERACAALTLRVALAMVLTPNLSWLILDEPTHNLDKEAVELLSQTLQTKVPEVVDQTFVITHEEALMGSDFASSYRLSRDKENLESTKVERI